MKFPYIKVPTSDLCNLHNAKSIIKDSPPMENPFIYGKVVKGKYFADREKEIETLTKEWVISKIRG